MSSATHSTDKLSLLRKIGLCCAIGLIAYHYFGKIEHLKSATEFRFEKWVANQKDPVTVHMKLSSANPGLAFSYSGEYLPTGENKINRLIQLADEADIFSITGPSPSGRNMDVRLELSTPDDSFNVYLNSRTIDRNSKLKNLLKLLQVYSSEETAKSHFSINTQANNANS